MPSPSTSVGGRGAARTVSVASVVVAVPLVLVNTARYFLPLSAVDAANESMVPVWPLRLVNVAPPLVLTCHCTVGAGVPLALAWNVAAPPAVVNTSDGFSVTDGGESAGGAAPTN